ncbi:MAG: response regulator [Eubacteriales bacterium]|nr:response regulator [Eubacteriales bacterium]
MYTVLLVDDERPSRMVLKKLGDWDQLNMGTILEADSSAMALDIIKNHAIDVIITDMNMPEIDGVAFLKELSTMSCEPYILVVSGHTDFEYTHQAIISRVQNYLLKPVKREELNRNLLEIYNALESRGDNEELTDAGTDAGTEAGSGKLIQDIKKYIDHNYALALTLEQIASLFFVSKEHVSRLFRKKYGMKLFDYINEMRLDHVCELLHATGLSIDEISVRSGFSCGNYLSKAFKKRYNVTPGEYRRYHDVSDR